jgi:hypothetical protein
MDDEKPSTKHLVLRPKEIIPIDKLARPGDGSAISVQLIHRQNQLAEEKASRRNRGQQPAPEPVPDAPQLSPVFKPKDIVPTDPPAHLGDEEAISVPEILLENRIAEDESGWGRVRHRRKRLVSRRTRDFILGVGAVDLVIILVTWFAHNAISMIYGIAAITLLTSTFAWIMFFVMDDY